MKCAIQPSVMQAGGQGSLHAVYVYQMNASTPVKGFRHHQLSDFNIAGSFNLEKKSQGTKVMNG